MPSSRSLGSLTLDLLARIGGFTGPLDQAGRIADKRMREIERRAKQFGQVLGLALTAAATALAAGVKHAIDQADALNDLNQRLGITAEALSGWAYAAKQTGTDIDGLSIGLKKLSKNMAEALDSGSTQGKLFAALDVKPIDEATGKLKTLEQVLPEIADKFKALHDETLEAALAQQLFGKSGTDLLEFLNLGSAGIEDMRSKLRDLGGELSQGTLTAADQFNDKMGDLHTAVDGMFTALAADLLPEMDKLLTSMIDGAKDASTFRQNFDNLVTVIKYFGEVCTAVADTTRGLTSAVLGLYNAADSLSKLNPGRALGEWVGGLFGGEQGDTFADNWREMKTAAEQTAESFGLIDTKARAATQAVAGFGKGIRGGGGKGFGGADSAGTPVDAKALYDLLNGDDPKSKKTGKSDAERQAEQMEQAYARMKAQMQEQIALFGQTGEAAKVAYEIANGEASKFSTTRQQELLDLARKADLQRAEAEEVERLNKLDEERRKTIEAAHQALTETFSDMQFEIDLFGKSNAARTAEIELRRIGSGLSAQEEDAAKRRLTAMAEQLEALHEQVAAMDEFRQNMVDNVAAVLDGSKSIKEAFEDMAKSILQQITRLLAQRWVDQLFGQQGTSQTGSAGGWLSKFFGLFVSGGPKSAPSFDPISVFGGPRALGGPVEASKLYEVGEGGRPELFSSGGRTFLIPGQSGAVMPISHLPGGGISEGAGAGGGRVEVNIHNNGGGTARTEERMQGGTQIIDVFIEAAKNAVAQDIGRNGTVGKAIGSRFGVQPAGVARG